MLVNVLADDCVPDGGADSIVAGRHFLPLTCIGISDHSGWNWFELFVSIHPNQAPKLGPIPEICAI